MHECLERILWESQADGKTKQQRAGMVLAILQRVQREFGYIPQEAIPRVARLVGVPESHLYGVATFYAHFKFTPSGRNVITVCRGTACHVRGSNRLLRDVSGRLGIGPGETTADKVFTLHTVACFGSCALGPLVVINGRVYGRMTKPRVMKMIDALAEEARASVCQLAEEAAR